MRDLSVNLAGVRLKNPIVPVSGTFGFGREYSKFYDLSRLGGICVKGLTRHERQGNPPPRIAETPMGTLNSVGLQNPGVQRFISEELPFLRQFDTVIIANISGNTVEEYSEMAELLGDKVDLIEVNVSCPNVKQGGLQFGITPEGAASATAAVKRFAGCPIITKLSPNVTDIASIAVAAKQAGADGISLINTVLGMRIDVATRRPILHMNTGGLSGPAVLPIALRCVWQVAKALPDCPILGMGGVSSGEAAVEMLLAGASAVGVGTAIFQDPYAPIKIIAQLEEYMAANNSQNIKELSGGIINW